MKSISKYGLGGILLTCIAFLITYIAVKKDKKTFNDSGFRWERKTPVRFTVGFIIGILITVLMLIIMISFTDLEINYNFNSNVPSILFWLLAFFPLALMEEIIFRGYAFTKINNNWGLWPAQILLALLFTWYHDFTGLTFFNQLLGPGIWALIYGISAIWSKGIAFPTGLHMAINVVLALVGVKDNKPGLWIIDFAKEITPDLLAQTEMMGLVLQLCILIIGVILTEFYRRNKLKSS
ncbi:CPBP family intramembrane glutamic endopeptidase [Psychroserpens sp. AS72]|uniref:CPBP family intramembrane glutamic endopeptidase n=1 Tax=Psychroserpens sp. AS72 TaxID=3135775 RepID=UPI0031817CE5